jgi:YidC/Oxa1 family membrane protein insertase
MEKRAILALVLSLLVFLVYQLFFVPEQKPKPPKSTPATEQPAPAVQGPTPQKGLPAPSATPAAPLPAFRPRPAHPPRDVVVETPLYRAVLTEAGGRLKSFGLKQYRETIATDSPPKELVRSPQADELPLAFNFMNHPVAGLDVAQYAADRTSLVVDPADGSKKLTFTYQVPGWLRITREYQFYPNTYSMDLTIRLANLGSQGREDAPAVSLINSPLSPENRGGYNFNGPALFVGGKLDEVAFKDIKAGGRSGGPTGWITSIFSGGRPARKGTEGELRFAGPIDWIAYTSQHFTMAVVPEGLVPNLAQLKVLNAATEMVETTFVGPALRIEPDAQQELQFKIYAGPKEIEDLKAAHAKLEKAIDFGWFDIIAQPLLLSLKFFYRYIHNYGIAIIILTVLIKLAFWPLTNKSFTSMQAMKKVQPMMQKIREKYKDDPQRMNQEIMQLYRTQKVNPFGGCLPMVLQIPVFFALYKVLNSSITMRHAPFIWWINDLSAPDRLPVGFDIPYVGGFPVLTLLMGASMFIQQKMTPMTGDPRQAKLMLLMPVVFTFMFVNFPSGLTLYWFVNNILSIGQQYLLNRKTDQSGGQVTGGKARGRTRAAQ